MKFIYYVSNQEKIPRKKAVCLHLMTPIVSVPEHLSEVWLESFNPENIILSAGALSGCKKKKVLNSIWADPKLAEIYKYTLYLFDNVVVIPFNPTKPMKDFDDCLEDVEQFLRYLGVPSENIICDIRVFPYALQPDITNYEGVIASIKSRGYKTVGAIDNYIYKAPNKEELANDFYQKMKSYGLDYLIITEMTERKLYIRSQGR